ncbi:hypothetical protein BDV09DRAFT_175388 [Aspergillus tetrazonus]
MFVHRLLSLGSYLRLMLSREDRTSVCLRHTHPFYYGSCETWLAYHRVTKASMLCWVWGGTVLERRRKLVRWSPS